MSPTARFTPTRSCDPVFAGRRESSWRRRSRCGWSQQRSREKCTVQLGIGLSREYLGWTDQKRNVLTASLRLLYAGRLLEWKGLDLAIHAVRRLRDRGVRARFTIVGEGPARESLERLAAELGVAEDVRWVTWLPHDQLHEHYYQHDVLLFPSLRDSGGMVVLEALAHGLPVVCTDRGGPGAIVNDRCGRVVRTSGRTKDEVIGEIDRRFVRVELRSHAAEEAERGGASTGVGI